MHQRSNPSGACRAVRRRVESPCVALRMISRCRQGCYARLLFGGSSDRCVQSPVANSEECLDICLQRSTLRSSPSRIAMADVEPSSLPLLPAFLVVNRPDD